MTPDPTLRAVAERLARENYASLFGGSFDHLPPEVRDNLTSYTLAGLTHRDRTAEREAARKAWDAAAERRYGPGWPIHSSSDKARDAYLAAEFDAGERVTLSDGSVVTYKPRDNDGKYLWFCVGGRVSASSHWHSMLDDQHTSADFEKLKAFAAKQGWAER